MKRIPKRTIVLIVFLGTILLSFLIYKTLSVSTIELKGAQTLIGLDQFSSKPLFLIKNTKAAHDLLAKNPSFESIEISGQYPNKLIITATRSKMVGALKVSGGFYQISSTGKVLAKVRNIEGKLPLITLQQLLPYESYAVGQIMSNREVVFSAYLLGKFAENNIPIDTVEMQGFDVVLCKGAGRTYVFSASKDKVAQFVDVAVIYRQFFIEGKKYSKIDVRFDKPIIVFEK